MLRIIYQNPMDEIWTFVPYKHLPLESDSHFPNQPFLAILLHEFLAPENRLWSFLVVIGVNPELLVKGGRTREGDQQKKFLQDYTTYSRKISPYFQRFKLR